MSRETQEKAKKTYVWVVHNTALKLINFYPQQLTNRKYNKEGEIIAGNVELEGGRIFSLERIEVNSYRNRINTHWVFFNTGVDAPITNPNALLSPTFNHGHEVIRGHLQDGRLVERITEKSYKNRQKTYWVYAKTAQEVPSSKLKDSVTTTHNQAGESICGTLNIKGETKAIERIFYDTLKSRQKSKKRKRTTDNDAPPSQARQAMFFNQPNGGFLQIPPPPALAPDDMQLRGEASYG